MKIYRVTRTRTEVCDRQANTAQDAQNACWAINMFKPLGEPTQVSTVEVTASKGRKLYEALVVFNTGSPIWDSLSEVDQSIYEGIATALGVD